MWREKTIFSRDILKRLADKEALEGVGVLVSPDSDRIVSYVLETHHCDLWYPPSSLPVDN